MRHQLLNDIEGGFDGIKTWPSSIVSSMEDNQFQIF